MEVKPWTGTRPAATDLSRAPGFALGPLAVEPSARRVTARGRSEMLEPRVMRVLVALGETPGAVFSRDDLIELCWDGQIVSDNAINRAISLLRRLLEELGGGAVRLETITKVGFRLVVDMPARDAAPGGEAVPSPGGPGPAMQAAPIIPLWRRKWTRRAAAAGVVVLGAGAGLSYAGYWTKPRHLPDSRALDLYRRGQMTQKTSEPGSMRQAMADYTQAIEIDPDYADAWGALAIGYRHGGDGFIKGPKEAYPRLVRSAAGRALSLDPDQPDARMALATIYSDFGKWREREAKLRAIVQRSPGYWYGWAQLDLLMQDVGRFEEAIGYRKRMLEIDSTPPVAWAYFARALHYAGRDHEADIALDRAFARWPANPILWYMRFQILIGGKRYTEAAAFARDPRSQPEQMPDETFQSSARIADALTTKTGIEQVLAHVRGNKHLPIDALPATAAVVAELGDATMAFGALQAYFFGGTFNGQRVAAPGEVEARDTSVLFSPSIMQFKADPRHAMLLTQTGLEDYWRKTGTQPDYRRG